MESLKQEAINVILKMPVTAEIDDIMYRLYVIDKVRKGRVAIQRMEAVSIENLKALLTCPYFYSLRAFAAKASACRMASRVKRGWASRICSAVSPAANFSKISSTVIRVPAIIGLPIIMAGSDIICKFWVSILLSSFQIAASFCEGHIFSTL